jgi:hypothetical protein
MASYEELFYILGLLATGAFVAALVARYAMARARERDRRGRFVEAQIERLATTKEFVDFAGSAAGLAWLRADSGEARVRRGLLALVGAGILALALGAALLLNAGLWGAGIDPSDALARADANWWGSILLALGGGALVASFVLVRLGRAWGLLPLAAGGRAPGE